MAAITHRQRQRRRLCCFMNTHDLVPSSYFKRLHPSYNKRNTFEKAFHPLSSSQQHQQQEEEQQQQEQSSSNNNNSRTVRKYDNPKSINFSQKEGYEFWSEVFQKSDNNDDDDDDDDDDKNRIVSFNNAGASPSPPSVLRTVASHLALEASVGGYLAEEMVQDQLHETYYSIVRLLNAQHPKEIALVESATVAWTRIFYSVAETLHRAAATATTTTTTTSEPTKHRIILTSEVEYAANVVPMIQFARRMNQLEQMKKNGYGNGGGGGGGGSNVVEWKVMTLPSSLKSGSGSSGGMVDLQVLDQILSGSYYNHPTSTSTSSNREDKLQGHCADDDRYNNGIDHDDHDDKKTTAYIKPEDIAMICITHIPTNSGIINPVNEIGQRIHQFNKKQQQKRKHHHLLPSIFYLVDACQSVGQIQLNVQKMHCHALTATGRKYLRGPRGTGFLYVNKDVVEFLEPSHLDHFCAPISSISSSSSLLSSSTVTRNDDFTKPLRLDNNNNNDNNNNDDVKLNIDFLPGAKRFEFWESNIANRLGLGAAIHYAMDIIGLDYIERRCVMLGSLLRQRLKQMNGITVYYPDNNDYEKKSRQCGIVTFSVKNMDATMVRTKLLQQQTNKNDRTNDNNNNDDHHHYCRFELTTVPPLSTPMDSMRTGTSDYLVRASLTYFNTEKEIDDFCRTLQNIL